MKTYKLLSTIFICMIFLNACNSDSNQNSVQQAQDVEQVKKTFNVYKTAVLSQKGYDAMKCLNQKTIDYYDNILRAIQEADKEKIMRMAPVDQLEILAVRRIFPKEQIFALTGITLYSTAVTEGLMEAKSLKTLNVGHVALKGDKAKAQIVVNGEKTPIYFDFSKEDNQWKINIASAKVLTSKYLETEAKKANLTTINYILDLLKLSEEEKIKIFEPLKT